MTKLAGATESVAELLEQVFEHGGMLWKAESGAGAPFEEFIAARQVFGEIARESLWNPWVREDRAEESDRALVVIGAWTRAEPGFRQMTEQEVDEMLVESSERGEAVCAADHERWERDKKRFDPEREAARLALLEEISRLEFVRGELARFADMDPTRASGWAGRIAELGKEAEDHPLEITRLEAVVGIPEDVADVRGQLPRDRRSTMLLYYQLDRERDVRRLRTRIAELKAALDKKTERSRLRAELRDAEQKLSKLLAVPPLDAEDMCAECATPAGRHGWLSPPSDSPCPAWPRWGARLKKVRQMLMDMPERPQPKESEPLKPQPIATMPSGLPIADVIAQLTELQAEHPDAVVKRGRANRWELWPAKEGSL